MVFSTRARASLALMLSFAAGACGGGLAQPAARPPPASDVTVASAGPAPSASAAPAASAKPVAPSPDARPAPSQIPNTSIRFAGGDGSSVDHAVAIRGARGEADGVAAEYWYVGQLLGVRGVDWRVGMQALLEKNGHDYDMLEVASRGAKRRFFFDISDFFGHF
jgi:hypothetical protein